MQQLKEQTRTGAMSFDEQVSMYAPALMNVILGIVQQQEDAEEILQDVFVKFFEKKETLQTGVAHSTWLWRVAINESNTYLRRKRAVKRGGLLTRVFGFNAAEEPCSWEHPGVLADKKDDAKLLFKALGQLPDKQRSAFLLQQLEGLPVAVIADVLQVSTSAAEALIKRAKQNLRTTLYHLI